MVRITGEIGEPPGRMIDLLRLYGLRGISVDGARSSSARHTYTEIRRSDVCPEHLPALVEAAATIGAAQIQNRGTLGGNLRTHRRPATRSRSCSPLDAAIVVGGARGERTIPAYAFWVAYRRTALAPDELILRVHIPSSADARPASGRSGRGGPRRSARSSLHSPGARTAAPASTLVTTSGLPSGPSRPTAAGRRDRAVLEGATPTPEAADAAAEALATEIQPHRRRPLNGRLPAGRGLPPRPPDDPGAGGW